MRRLISGRGGEGMRMLTGFAIVIALGLVITYVLAEAEKRT